MSTDTTLSGTHGDLVVRTWDTPSPRYVVLLAHGYGEHSGRYEHVAAALNAAGAVVYAPDHAGHGRSAGERARADFVEDMVTDLDDVRTLAAQAHPGLPVVVLGHSMGGVIATRYVQRYDGISALVLSGPIVGGNPGFTALLDMDPLPDVPLAPEALSRDAKVGEAYAADELVYHGPLQRESLEGLVQAVAAVAAGRTLGDLPTLWLHGENDPLAPLDATRPAIEHIAGIDLKSKVYEGAMHEIFNETNQDEVLADVVAFLAEVPALKG
jgi:alpha-beta hydrolase superfamily lysophospholipase